MKNREEEEEEDEFRGPSRSHVYTPIWHHAVEPITLWERRSLASYVYDSSVMHPGEPRRIIRFGVTDSGRLLSGDAWHILHADICRSALAVGDDDQLLAGVALLGPDAMKWDVRVQALTCKHPMELLRRLSTWHHFIGKESMILRRMGDLSVLDDA